MLIRIKITSGVADCRYFNFFLGFLMANLAKEAVEGMQEKLQQLQKQGKFKPERATAAK